MTGQPHMRVTIKCSVDQAAQTIGRGCEIVNHITTIVTIWDDSTGQYGVDYGRDQCSEGNCALWRGHVMVVWMGMHRLFIHPHQDWVSSIPQLPDPLGYHLG